jgi:YggT family protein
VRWSYRLTEPILGPLRRVLPPLGMFDLSPIVAWLLLEWVIRPLLVGLVNMF